MRALDDVHLAVTGVGSLPSTDPQAAVDLVVAHAPRLPFVPQLPGLGPAEGMVRQALGDDLPGVSRDGLLHVAAGDRDLLVSRLLGGSGGPVGGVALPSFARAVRAGRLPFAHAVKGQIAGPVTVAASLHVGGGPVAEDPELVGALCQRLVRRSLELVGVLGDLGLPVLLVLDEPVLGLAAREDGPPAAGGPPSAAPLPLTAVVLDAVRAVGCTTGVHTCATGDLGVLRRLAPDLVSIDVAGRTPPSVPPSVRRSWQAGAVLAAGVVPSVGPAEEDRATAIARRVGEGDRGPGLVLTAACGLAGATPAEAVRSFEVLHRVATRLDELR